VKSNVLKWPSRSSYVMRALVNHCLVSCSLLTAIIVTLHCFWDTQRPVMPSSWHSLPAGLRVAQPCRYCFYSLAQKWVFRPAGATRCPDTRESWHGGADRIRSPLPSFTFIGAKRWKYSLPKLSKFRILARNLYLRRDSFAIFLRNSQLLYASIGSF